MENPVAPKRPVSGEAGRGRGYTRGASFYNSGRQRRLRLHRFYLLPDDCESINVAVQEIERRFAEEDPTAVRVIRETFEPDTKMQPAFYYAPEDQEI